MRINPIVLLSLSCAALGACASLGSTSPAPVAADASLGSVVLHSTRLGQVTLRPNRCQAGDRAFFLGADFIDDASGVVLRLAFDPLGGAAVRIFVPGGAPERSFVFRRADCRVLDASVEPTLWKINDVSDYHLGLKLECANGGDAAIGEVAAAHCH